MVSKLITNQFPGFDIIYDIDDPFNNRYYRGDVDLEEFRHISARNIFNGKSQPKKPITITYQMWGKQIADIIWTGLIGIGPIISSNLLSMLKCNKFTGWSTYRVRVFSKTGDLVPGYHGLSIVGRCGPIDYSKSELVTFPAPYPGGAPHDEYVGMFFDPATWDGSDLFCPEGMTAIFAVERVVKAFKKAKIKNLRYTKLTEQSMHAAAVNVK